jgi:hypothetical protein
MGFASIAWARIWRRPAVAPVIAELRDQATGDSPSDVLTHFERIVGRGLGRHVFMFEVTPGGFRGLTDSGYRAGIWIARPGGVQAWFRASEASRLPERLSSRRHRVEALLPIVGDSAAAVGMVAIGGRFLRRLSSRERSLVEAAVGMAFLLMQQAELQQQVDAAQDVSANAKRVATSQRIRVGIRSYLDSSRN